MQEYFNLTSNHLSYPILSYLILSYLFKILLYPISYSVLFYSILPSSPTTERGNKGSSKSKSTIPSIPTPSPTSTNSLFSYYLDLFGLTLATQFLATFNDSFYLLFALLPIGVLYYLYTYFYKGKKLNVDQGKV